MTLEEAIRIIGDGVRPGGRLYDLSCYLDYVPGNNTVCLDGDFNADYLEAIAVYMRSQQSREVGDSGV